MQVCQAAWETLYHVSHMSTLKLVKQVKLGDLDPTTRPLKTGTKETKQDYVKSWLDTFFKSIADIMPDNNGRESQHLPEWTRSFAATLLRKVMLAYRTYH